MTETTEKYCQFCHCAAMIIKNVKATTTVETILKALDPYAYLDERNVRLVKGKTPGAKCFCFVDMDSHEVRTCNPLWHWISMMLQRDDSLFVQRCLSTNRNVVCCSKWHVWLSCSPNPDRSTSMESEFTPRLLNPWKTRSEGWNVKVQSLSHLWYRMFLSLNIIFCLFQFKERFWQA